MARFSGLIGSGWDDPKTIGILQAAAGLLQAGGPSAVPVGFGQALGQGMTAGLQGYQGQQQFMAQKKRAELEAEAAKLEMEAIKQQQAEATKMQGILGGVFGQQGAQQSNWRLPMKVPTAGQSANLPVWQQLEQAGQKLAEAGQYEQAQKYFTLSEQKKPKQKQLKDQRPVMVNGSVQLLNIYDDGTEELSTYAPAEKLDMRNTGDAWQGINPYTGQTVGNKLPIGQSADSLASTAATMRGQNLTDTRERFFQSPENKRAQELAAASGKAQVTAMNDLPKLTAIANEGFANIDAMIGKRDANGNLLPGSAPHPGFGSAVGFRLPRSIASNIPFPTDANDFNVRLDQVLGGAFMEAFQTLKGGGQITEVEGAKATAAITRMNNSQSESEFVKAAQEFKEVIQRGLNRAQTNAGQGAQTTGGVKFLGFE